VPIRGIEVSGYRWMEHGRIGIDTSTFIFGENDSGRSAVIEALRLTLGSREASLAIQLKPHHFGRDAAGEQRPMHIRVEVAEDEPGAWDLPARMAEAFPPSVERPRVLFFDFRATLQDNGLISVSRGIQSRDRFSTSIDGDAESEAWLRSAFPVLWLGPGALTSLPESAALGQVDLHGGEMAEDPDVRALVEHQRNLISGSTADVGLEIEMGALAAQAVLNKYPRVFAGAAPVISAMAAEILGRAEHVGNAAVRSTAAPSHPAGKIAVLLFATAMIDLADDVLRMGPLPDYAQPVIVLENIEANLHPTTIASMWRVIESVAWQKILVTHSATVLSYAPVTALRRLTRQGRQMISWSVLPHTLSRNALRKIDYHLRSRRAPAIFARCWILVEGETEFWVLPELARIMGYDLAAEGVACIEFAQSGPQPLLRVAAQFGIGCHVMSDGDNAGQGYAEVASKYAPGTPPAEVAITALAEPDIEHCFWIHGFADVITRVANLTGDNEGRSPTSFIHHAIDRTSKPYLALALVEAAADRGRSSVPPPLAKVIESAVQIARARSD